MAVSRVFRFCLRFKAIKIVKNKKGKGRKKGTKAVDTNKMEQIGFKGKKRNKRLLKLTRNNLSVNDIYVNSKSVKRLTNFGVKTVISKTIIFLM